MIRILSPQQEIVRNFPNTHRGSAFAEAVAGAGKTTTAMFMIAETAGTVGVMAYNKSAAREFETKAQELGLSFGNRVRFGTCHSFGFGAWRYVHKNVKAGPEAAREKNDAMLLDRKVPKVLHSFVPRLISLAKQNAIGLYGAITDEKLYYDIIEHHDLDHEIEDEGLVAAAVQHAIDGMTYHKLVGPDIIDFDDMIWLPVVTGVRMFGNDWVVGDEWQDANPARRALARKMLKPNGRALFIGDRHQAIYGFCHPPGTKVLTPTGYRRIEHLSAGDKIIAVNTSKDVAGWKGDYEIVDTTTHQGWDWLIELRAGDKKVRMTPHHRVPVKIDETAPFITYLMRKNETYRVGYMATYVNATDPTDKRFMLSQRAKMEGADAAWILASHTNRFDAVIHEASLHKRGAFGGSFTYLSDEEIDTLPQDRDFYFDILREHGRLVDFPIWRVDRRQHFEKNLPFITEACNVMPGMRVQVLGDWDSRKRGRSRHTGDWHPATVQHISYDKSMPTHGITVRPLRNGAHTTWPLYVADGIVVHNTGADADSINQTIKEFNCTELSMTVTFRCPKAVVERARTVVSHIEAHESAPEGSVTTIDERQFGNYDNDTGGTVIDEWHEGAEYGPVYDAGFDQVNDAILCRNTKPLVATAFQLIKRGIPCHVEGRDIGAGLIELIDRFSSARTMTALRDRMTAYKEQQMAKLIAKGKETQAQSIEDKVDTILVIAEHCASIDDLKIRIRGMFEDAEGERKPTLTLSTIHKSKGREWQRVFLMGENIYMPSGYARQEWQLEQERNLQYVAYTRAKSELVLVNMTRD